MLKKLILIIKASSFYCIQINNNIKAKTLNDKKKY